MLELFGNLSSEHNKSFIEGYITDEKIKETFEKEKEFLE